MSTSQLLQSAWEWNGWVIASCVAMVAVFVSAIGIRGNRRAAWFFVGIVLLYLTLASPIDVLADGYLFSAHMLQHLLLLLVIPPLLLLGLPKTEKLKNFRWLAWAARYPIAAWVVGLGGMWLWHAPTLCNAAVTNPWVHRLQYVSLLGMGASFWWPILNPAKRQRLSPLAGIVYLITACLGCTVLGIIITFSPVEVCSVYLHPVDRLGALPLLRQQWGLTPARDQQIGGLLMWVPSCLIYLIAIMGMLARWYAESGAEILTVDVPPARTPRREAHGN